MPKRIARLQSGFAIGVLALAPMWVTVPLVATHAVYRRYKRQKRNES